MKSRTLPTVMKSNWQYIAVAGLLALTAAITAWSYNTMNDTDRKAPQATINTNNAAGMDVNAALEEHGIVPLASEDASNNSATAKDLAYLIEEEKLAHDVYQAMYDKWGSRVFGNIQKSETMHRSMVLTVMRSRDLADPTKADAGKFTDPELQALYDSLIAQGNKSVADAYKVGVIIEERDIADLKESLAALDAKDTDIKQVLESLLQGSENHLRAFNRQQGR